MGYKPTFKSQDKRNASGFPYRGHRVVKRHGLISWHHVTYYHADLEAYEGDTVEVNFTGSCVWSDGIRVCEAQRKWVEICDVPHSLEGRALSIVKGKEYAALAAIQEKEYQQRKGW